MVALPKNLNYQWFRIGLFIALLGGVGLSLGRSLLFSQMGAAVAVQPVAFPTEIPLTGWQSAGSHEIQERSLKSLDQIISNSTPTNIANALPAFAEIPVAGGRVYQYRQGPRSLRVEMRYLVNTQGDVPALLTAHPAGRFYTDRPPVTLREQREIGAFGIFSMQGNTYLSSCINPQGTSTFTRQQFVSHHLQADLAPQHLWHWLLNRAEIPDRRCLWVYMWIADSSAAETSQTLEAAWSSWYAEWRSRVPNY